MENETMKQNNSVLTFLRDMHPYDRGVGLCGVLIAGYAVLYILHMLIAEHQIAVPELMLLLLLAIIFPWHFKAAQQDAHKQKTQQKRFAACGYIGIFYILVKFLWSCFLPLDLLSAYDIYDLPELPQWLSLFSYDSLGTLGCMALSVLILFFSAPNGRHGRLPRILFVRLPRSKKALPVRLLLYALEAALLICIPTFLFCGTYDLIGNFGNEPWRDSVQTFLSKLPGYLPDYLKDAVRIIPIFFVLELIAREYQVYVYNRKSREKNECPESDGALHDA